MQFQRSCSLRFSISIPSFVNARSSNLYNVDRASSLLSLHKQTTLCTTARSSPGKSPKQMLCLTPQTSHPVLWNNACANRFGVSQTSSPAICHVDCQSIPLSTSRATLIFGDATARHCGPRPCPLWLHRLLAACREQHSMLSRWMTG